MSLNAGSCDLYFKMINEDQIIVMVDFSIKNKMQNHHHDRDVNAAQNLIKLTGISRY